MLPLAEVISAKEALAELKPVYLRVSEAEAKLNNS